MPDKESLELGDRKCGHLWPSHLLCRCMLEKFESTWEEYWKTERK